MINKLMKSKIGRWLAKGLAILNLYEGIIHLVVALIGIWGVIKLGQWNWQIIAPIIENVLFGILSILTGFYLKEFENHHH